MKYKKALVIVYFGKFNNYFPLWLKSCAYNPEFTWIIYTDDHTEYTFPSNVLVHYTTFDKVKKVIQDLFEFKISLETPYKLCDFRPAYGEIFKKELSEYEYWGYCDVDLIWGNLSKFYPDSLLEKYDKISDAGHFTLYKNNEQMKTAYRVLTAEGCLNYREVYSNSKNFAFDEWGNNKGINNLLRKNRYDIFYKPILFSDIQISTYGLFDTKRFFYETEKLRHNIMFAFDRGKLVQYSLDINGEILKSEEAYIHLQKRPMKFKSDVTKLDSFAILPPNYFAILPKDINKIYLKSIKEKGIYWHYFYIRYKNLIRKLKEYTRGK